MENIRLLVDLHRRTDRQGPGGEAETRLAIRLAGLDAVDSPRIVDIGCGSGASTLLLARLPGARVEAVDLMSEFIEDLKGRTSVAGLSGRIRPVQASMERLPFEDETFDAIWSEGAIYNIGFERGVVEWRRFLKPGGILALSEVTWLTAERPAELQAFWDSAYPEIDTAARKLAVLERNGYTPRAYFVLPQHCWLDNYYAPLERLFDAFLDRHGHRPEARALVRAERDEIALYRKYQAYFGYGFYIADKCG